MTASISTTSEILASVRSLDEIKNDVYAIANKYSVRAVDTTAKLKDWANRNLKILPSDFNLRARKTWENLKTLVERYDYQQEQEKRQDAALADWDELEEAVTEEEIAQAAIGSQVAACVAEVRATYDLQNANEFMLVQVRSSGFLAYSELVSGNYYASYFALDGEVWNWYSNLDDLLANGAYQTAAPDCIAAACRIPDPELDADIALTVPEGLNLSCEVYLSCELPSPAAPVATTPEATPAPLTALQLARVERRAAIAKSSAAALTRRLAHLGLKM